VPKTIAINLMESKIDRIINIIRSLKEEGMVTGAPTNSLIGGKIAGTVEAGDNPPVRKKNKYIYGAGFRKNWLQKRNPPR
jgi:hypothetical protein